MKRNRKHRPRRRPNRYGLTLIELLVVVFILMLITTIAIPVMTPSNESRNLRETSRVVTAFLAGARTRAIQTGRPFGVWIEQEAGLTESCTRLFYAEVHPPYAGDTTNSVATVSSGNITALGTVNATMNQNNDSGYRGLVRPGDIIKFNYQGHLYILNTAATNLDANGYMLQPTTMNPWTTQRVSNTTISAPDTPGAPFYGLPYQIFRRPSKTSAPPVQLPAGMVLDLAASGTLNLDPFTGQTGPYIVLFDSNGALNGVAYTGGSLVASGPVYLLIGKRVNIGGNPEYPTTSNIQYNYQDLTNIWVTIQPQTGLVTSTEVGGDANNNGTISPAESRQYAARALSMGGR